MFGTSFIVHIVALIVVIWGSYEIISLTKQKNLLIKHIKLKPKGYHLIQNPLEYIVFLAKIFNIPYSGKNPKLFPAKKKIKGDTTLAFLASNHISQIYSDNYTHKTNHDKITIVIEIKPSILIEKEMEEILSKDLCLIVKIRQQKERKKQ